MAWPSDLVRTKNWGTEILYDTDLEGQFDLIVNWLMAFANESTGHTHTAAENKGPKITLTAGTDQGVTGVLPLANFASIDEDNMASDSATQVPTQQSVKAYVDTKDSAQTAKFHTSTGHDHDGSDSKKIPVGSIDATGTPGAGNYLRGDGTWTDPKLNTVRTAGGVVVLWDESTSSTTAGSYTKIKEAVSNGSGTLRIDFDIQGGIANNRYAKIYRNGVAVGTERLSVGTSETWTTYTEDIAGWAVGDLIQIYGYQTGNTCSVKNFKVKVTQSDGFTLQNP